MVDISKNLGEYQSTHILVLDTRSAGFTQTIRMMIQGNSLLSSIFVKSITGEPELTVKYFEITTGLEADEQKFLDEAHPTIIAASSVPDQRLLTPFHDKLFCEVTLSGTGTMEFGIYVTVVANFASLMDKSLKTEKEDATDLDPGVPAMVRDPADDKWYHVRGSEGRAQTQDVGSMGRLQYQFHLDAGGSLDDLMINDQGELLVNDYGSLLVEG